MVKIRVTKNFTFEIHEQIYPDKEGYISKNSLFKLIQKVFYCYLYSNLLVEEHIKVQKR